MIQTILVNLNTLSKLFHRHSSIFSLSTSNQQHSITKNKNQSENTHAPTHTHIRKHTHKWNLIKKQPSIRILYHGVDQINSIVNRTQTPASICRSSAMAFLIVLMRLMNAIADPILPICGIDQRRMIRLQTNWQNLLVC